MTRFLSNLLIFALSLVVWFAGNVWYGNLYALEWLGWLAAYPWWVQLAVAIMPSSFQLYLTENWDNDEDNPFDSRLTTIGAAMLTVVLDLGGPALGFLAISGQPFTWGSVAVALVVAFMVSWVAQHLAWTRGKALWASLGKTKTPAPAVGKLSVKRRRRSSSSFKGVEGE